jgi:hypothetical protein
MNIMPLKDTPILYFSLAYNQECATFIMQDFFNVNNNMKVMQKFPFVFGLIAVANK